MVLLWTELRKLESFPLDKPDGNYYTKSYKSSLYRNAEKRRVRRALHVQRLPGAEKGA